MLAARLDDCTPDCRPAIVVGEASVVDLSKRDFRRPEWAWSREEWQAVVNLLERNSEDHPIPKAIAADFSVLGLVSPDSIRWDERGPLDDPLILFSLPGFSRNQEIALIFLGFSCGVECGHTELIVLARGSDGWAVKRRLPWSWT